MTSDTRMGSDLDLPAVEQLARSHRFDAVTELILSADEARRAALAVEAEAEIKALGNGGWDHAAQQVAPGYALAIIAGASSAARAAAPLGRRGMQDRWNDIPIRHFLQIAHARELPWLGDLALRLAEKVAPQEGWARGWRFVAALLADTGTEPPVTSGVVRCWLIDLDLNAPGNADIPLADRLLADPFLDRLLPGVFDFDGTGGILGLPHLLWHRKTNRWEPSPGFPESLAGLAAQGRLDAGWLLEATVARLSRGGRPGDVRPFIALHEALAPSPEALTRHARDYARLLSDASSVVAGLAQRALRAVDEARGVELETLLDTSRHVLQRTEKGLIKSQLTWLEAVARREPDRVGEVLETVATGFGHPTLDVQERSLKVVAGHAGRLDPATAARLAEAAAGLDGDLRDRAIRLLSPTTPATPVAPAALAAGPLPRAGAAMPSPITSGAELVDEVEAVLREPSGLRWERVLAGLVTLHSTVDTTGPVATLLDHLRLPRATALRIGRDPTRPTHPDTDTRNPDDILPMRMDELVAGMRRSPVPALVSTPTLQTGSLDAATLLDRLRRAETEGWQPWPTDLEQALLRLPREIDGDVLTRATALTSPAGRTFAAWLAVGGLADPVSVRFTQDARTDPVAFPGRQQRPRRLVVNLDPGSSRRPDSPRLDLEAHLVRLDRPPVATLYDFIVATEVHTMALPHHREVVAAWGLPGFAVLAETDWNQSRNPVFRQLADSSGPIGPATSLGLCYGFGARNESDRAAAVDAFLAMAARDEPVGARVGRELDDLVGTGTVKLTRVAAALRDIHRAGASAALWKLLAAALPYLLPVRPAPPGLPDLVELATQAADAVGATGEIPQVAQVAGERGGSRLVKEARRLHATLTR